MIANVYGGKLAGTYNVDDLWKFADGKSEDLSEFRNAGACVHRAELDNQPTLEGYCEPPWGLREAMAAANDLEDVIFPDHYVESQKKEIGFTSA